MYKVELIGSSGSVVGFFEVDRTITLASLAARLEEVVRVGEVIRVGETPPAIYWQIRRPDGRILFQAKNLVGCVS